jgi:hypothetical protein
MFAKNIRNKKPPLSISTEDNGVESTYSKRNDVINQTGGIRVEPATK